MFATEIDKILERVRQIKPVQYAKTRNYIDGEVTRLSPYISRGVISTRTVLESVLKRGYNPRHIEKFIQELAWRDYFQNVWRAKGEAIDEDLKNEQADVTNHEVPQAVLEAETGITAIDKAIKELYEIGYVHNHIRMYIASIVCNIGKSYWRVPAKWFYYHLLDADWASNALSWQWTAGAFSNKKYFANQANINKFCRTDQRGTFLDVDYEDFPAIKTPEILQETKSPVLPTNLPNSDELDIDNAKPTLIYNFYNLDPCWKKDRDANRILLLEPSHFEKYPIADHTVEFVLDLAKNIDNIQVFTGEFDQLKSDFDLTEIYYKEHPTVKHYEGTEEERDWLFPEVRGYFPSFFKFYKQGKKFMKRESLFD